MNLHIPTCWLTLTILISVTLGVSQAQEAFDHDDSLLLQNGMNYQVGPTTEQFDTSAKDLVSIQSRKIKKHISSYRYEGIFLLKTSPIHFVIGDIRLGYEHRLTDKSALEVEFGFLTEPFLLRGTILEPPSQRSHNTNSAFIRYKRYVHLTRNSLSSDKRLQGMYIAPFLKAGYSAKKSNSNIIEKRFMIGTDVGFQSQFSLINLDIFGGVRYAQTSVYTVVPNSDTPIADISLRLGVRVGIDPFVRPLQYKIKNKLTGLNTDQARRKRDLKKENDLTPAKYKGCLVKISPWHLLHGDLRLGVERRLTSYSALEVEGGYQVSSLASHVYNGIIRYKYFGLKAKEDSNDKTIHGKYLAPFVNYGTSANASGRITEILENFQQFQDVNTYALIGTDLGIQTQQGPLNFDFFIGAGYSLLEPNENFVLYGETRNIAFNNSHLTFDKLALRMGFRVGINPFSNKK